MYFLFYPPYIPQYLSQEYVSNNGYVKENKTGIVDVWCFNLEKEFARFKEISMLFHRISIDTEYPGTLHPISYPSVKNNAFPNIKHDLKSLKVIQIGISFFGENGEQPQVHTWQFNMKFDLACDAYSQSSIEFLINHGMDFNLHKYYGIDHTYLGALLHMTGVILNPRNIYIGFQCGVDLAYILKLLKVEYFPETETKFFKYLSYYFPNIFDVKEVMNEFLGIRGGLKALANFFNVNQIGSQHEAGSDAVVTGRCYFEMLKCLKRSKIPQDFYFNKLHTFGGKKEQELAKEEENKRQVLRELKREEKIKASQFLEEQSHVEEKDSKVISLGDETQMDDEMKKLQILGETSSDKEISKEYQTLKEQITDQGEVDQLKELDPLEEQNTGEVIELDPLEGKNTDEVKELESLEDQKLKENELERLQEDQNPQGDTN